MLDFPRWKLLGISFVCLVFALLALPNVLPEKLRAQMPSFLPSKTMSLGLDLRGGSYLLLELQFERYLQEQMASVTDGLRSEMISRKVNYQNLRTAEGGIELTLMKPEEQEAAFREAVRAVDAELGFKSAGNGVYTLSYSDDVMYGRKLRLLEQSVQIVDKRVNETGTREPIIQRQGDKRIVLQVPGLQDPEHLKKLLGRTAKMTFHLVNEDVQTTDILQGRLPAGTRLIYGDQREADRNSSPTPYAIRSRVMLSGDMLVDASATFDQETNEPVVSFRFNTTGAQRFADITRDNVGKRFAIVLDDRVITAPVIRSPIMGGAGIITGQFTSDTANDLAVLLRSGALPVPLKVVEERSVGPSLGADSIESGKTAAILGVVLVMIFMLINYGLFGIFANIALFVNLVFIIGALSMFQATLTLPGIAGMVLTLGMAVDANVLIYERIREEQRNGKSPFAAVDSGFRMAKGTILDSNITTLLAAMLLYIFGTGSVRGFAVTLSIGILTSMFTAIVLTRLMAATWLRRRRPKSIPI